MDDEIARLKAAAAARLRYDNPWPYEPRRAPKVHNTYLQAASPDVILRLIARLERLEQASKDALAGLKGQEDWWHARGGCPNIQPCTYCVLTKVITDAVVPTEG